MTERDDAIYGSFAGGGKDEAMRAALFPEYDWVDVVALEAQRDLLLALLKRTAKILVELDNFYPGAMPDDIDDLIIGAADAIAAVTGDE